VRHAYVFVALVLVLVPCAACGGDDDAGGAGGPRYAGGPVAESELPGLAASAFCRLLQPCCEGAGLEIEVDTCASTFSGAFAESVASADASKYSYDAAAAGACLRALENAGDACSGDASPVPGGALCDDAFTGSVAPGGTCDSSLECEGIDVKCEFRAESTTGPGTCVSEPPADEGDPCYWTCTQEGPTRSCSATGSAVDEPPVRPRCYTNDGLHCAADGLCATRAGGGGACDTDEGCRDGLFCDEGACRPLLATGDACSFQGCGEGLFCKDGACAAQIAIGASCEPFMDECVGGGSCDQNGICMEGGELSDFVLGFICGASGG
jgi:hypothetical protein